MTTTTEKNKADALEETSILLTVDQTGVKKPAEDDDAKKVETEAAKVMVPFCQMFRYAEGWDYPLMVNLSCRFFEG